MSRLEQQCKKQAQVLDKRGFVELALAARGMLVQSDASVIDSLLLIAVPTMILVGAQDKTYLAAADYVETKIPGVRKVVIDAAGYNANLPISPRRLIRRWETFGPHSRFEYRRCKLKIL